MPQQTAVDGKGGVQGIEAGGYLHPLDLVDRLTIGKENTSFLQGGATVCKQVFDDQVLGLFCIDEGRCVGVLVGDDQGGILKTVCFEHCLHLCIGARGDLVDHGPREGDLLLEVRDETSLYLSILRPSLGYGHDRILELLPIVRTVVHAYQAEFASLCQIALIDK